MDLPVATVVPPIAKFLLSDGLLSYIYRDSAGGVIGSYRSGGLSTQRQSKRVRSRRCRQVNSRSSSGSSGSGGGTI